MEQAITIISVVLGSGIVGSLITFWGGKHMRKRERHHNFIETINEYQETINKQGALLNDLREELVLTQGKLREAELESKLLRAESVGGATFGDRLDMILEKVEAMSRHISDLEVKNKDLSLQVSVLERQNQELSKQNEALLANQEQMTKEIATLQKQLFEARGGNDCSTYLANIRWGGGGTASFTSGANDKGTQSPSSAKRANSKKKQG